MFNDKYGLTKAVLEGRKTQTRRIITIPNTFKGKNVAGFYVGIRNSDGFINVICLYNEDRIDLGPIPPEYKEGEIVAVAQSYQDAGYKCYAYRDTDEFLYFIKDGEDVAIPPIAETNKMYVKPIYMPHQVKMADVRIQRLQDISDEDCLKEGIEQLPEGGGYKPYAFYDSSIRIKSEKEGIHYGSYRDFRTPKEAYASLIDKVSGKGTWERNPYVFVYDFKLVK